MSSAQVAEDGPTVADAPPPMPVAAPRYYGYFAGTYRVESTVDGSLTGHALDLTTGEIVRDDSQLPRVLADTVTPDIRPLTAERYIRETETARRRYLRGDGPVFDLYDKINALHAESPEGLPPDRRELVDNLHQRTFTLWEQESASRAAGAEPGFCVESTVDTGKAAYFARVDDEHPPTDPRAVIRRSGRPSGGTAEHVPADGDVVWHPDQFGSRLPAEVDALDLLPITEKQARTIIQRWTVRTPSPAATAAPEAAAGIGEPAHTGRFAVWRDVPHRQSGGPSGTVTLARLAGRPLDPQFEDLPSSGPGRRLPADHAESIFTLRTVSMDAGDPTDVTESVALPTGSDVVQLRTERLRLGPRPDDLPRAADPGAVAEPVDPGPVLTGLGTALRTYAPADCRGAHLRCRAAGDVLELNARLQLADGSVVAWAPPAEIGQWLHRLRRVTYSADRGAWFSAEYVALSGAPLRIDYDYRTRPTFRLAEEPDWRTELRLFPRIADATPDWLVASAWRTPATGSAEPGGDGGARPVRVARLHDGHAPGSDGDQVAYRGALAPAERDKVLGYLGRAPLTLSPDGVASADQRTDGAWVWTDSHAYHLRQHDTAPQAEFLDHIRANGHRAPEYLHTAILRQAYDRAADPGSGAGSAEPPDAEAELVGAGRAVVAFAGEHGIDFRYLGIGRTRSESWCMIVEGSETVVFWQPASGARRREHRFADPAQAATHLIGQLQRTLRPLLEHRTDGIGDDLLPEPPLVTGDAPSSAVRGLEYLTLTDGTLLDRFGPRHGYTVYALGTVPAQRFERCTGDHRRFRVCANLTVTTGVVRATEQDSGGGRAYFLPLSIGELAEQGILAEVTVDSPTAPSRPPADGGRSAAIARVEGWLRSHPVAGGPLGVDSVTRGVDGWIVSCNSVDYLRERDPATAVVVPAFLVRDRDGAIRRCSGVPGEPSTLPAGHDLPTWQEMLEPGFRGSGLADLGVPDQAVIGWRKHLPDGTPTEETRGNRVAEPAPLQLGYPAMTGMTEHLLTYLSLGWFSRPQFLAGLLRCELLVPLDPDTGSPVPTPEHGAEDTLSVFTNSTRIPSGTRHWLVIDVPGLIAEFPDTALSINPNGFPGASVGAREIADALRTWPADRPSVRRVETAAEFTTFAWTRAEKQRAELGLRQPLTGLDEAAAKARDNGYELTSVDCEQYLLGRVWEQRNHIGRTDLDRAGTDVSGQHWPADLRTAGLGLTYDAAGRPRPRVRTEGRFFRHDVTHDTYGYHRVAGAFAGFALGEALGAGVNGKSWNEIVAAHGEKGAAAPDPATLGSAGAGPLTRLLLFQTEGLLRALDGPFAGTTAPPGFATASRQALRQRLVSGDTATKDPRGWLGRIDALMEPDSGDTASALFDPARDGVRDAPELLVSGLVAALAGVEQARPVARSLVQAYGATGTATEAATVLAELFTRLLDKTTMMLPVAPHLRAMLDGPAGRGPLAPTLAAVLRGREDRGRDDRTEIEAIGSGCTATDVLGRSLVAVARRFFDPRAALCASVNHSGDSAITGALAGAMIGSRVGLPGLPAVWLDQLGARDLIETVAGDAYWHFAARPPLTDERYRDEWLLRYPRG